MNEMYSMSIVTHNAGVSLMLAVVFINIFMLNQAKDIHIYAKKMRIFMPIGAGFIATILFTGVVMMAAKHLSFTVENILMIIFGVALIVLEAKRYARLKHLDLDINAPLEHYKLIAFKLLKIELALLVPISLWMWL